VSANPRTPPRASYRVQLHKDFDFAQAAALADYLQALGVSHVYTSPIMTARAGSTHGYDIIDHTRINPELGGEEGFEALHQALKARDLGLIVDIVPNHMGIGSDNAWWMDVLEWGQHSPYAGFFDIDWHSSRRNLEGKVLLPVLGDQFGAVLERGEIELRLDAEQGSFSAWYYEHRFPISPLDYPVILLRDGALGPRTINARLDPLIRAFTLLRDDVDSARLGAAELMRQFAAAMRSEPAIVEEVQAALNAFHGEAGMPDSWRPLGRLLDAQAYRLAYWRVSSDEINYRRFFDINTLGGLRVERIDLFNETHRRLLRLVEDGRIDGLRVDHIDGLLDPLQYTRRLQGAAGRPGEPCYIVVEKILAPHEQLPSEWPVAGTTGYDSLNLIGAALTDPEGERLLGTFYRRFSGVRESFEDILWHSKREILRNSLASEVSVLASAVYRLSSSRWRSRDFTLNAIREALENLIAAFPVYRSYVDREQPAGASDRRHIDWALGVAKRRAGPVETSVYDFIAGVLTGDLAGQGSPYPRDEVLSLAMRFQQLSGPAMAKGLEDTSFYRYLRLLSHNEVGGDPRRFSLGVQGFHHANQQRLEHFPHAMLSASTHDTKRGEDARARIACLAEIPAQWAKQVLHWARMNRRLRVRIGDADAPERNHEYYFYQSLLGCWPLDLDLYHESALADLAGRVEAAMVKAVREGKQRSSWVHQDAEYESALARFVRAALDPQRSRMFLDDFAGFALRLAESGMRVSLSQTLLRLTMPGVPDIYRGAELWDLSMVDPDNRRPVDYVQYRERLAEIQELVPGDSGSVEAASQLMRGWSDGGVKLHLIRTALGLRRRQPALFAQGDYLPIEAQGHFADQVLAFGRRRPDQAAITVAPRFWNRLIDANGHVDWQDTVLPLPQGRWRNLLDGASIDSADGPAPLQTLTRHFPVALLVAD